MRVENYSEAYFVDCVKLVEKFHKEYLTEYYGVIDPKVVTDTVNSFQGENSKNAFLLIANDSCVGLLAGMEIVSKLNGQRFFHEIMWYVAHPFGRYGFYLVNQTKIMLKSFGFDSMIMSVIENPKSSRIKKIYGRMGFKPMESHYFGVL